MDMQQTGAPAIRIVPLAEGKGIEVWWTAGEGTMEEFSAVVEQELHTTTDGMILLNPGDSGWSQEPVWALPILLLQAVRVSNSGESDRRPDIGVWDERCEGFVVVTQWGDDHLERGTLVRAPVEQEGPCSYCGRITTGTMECPSWNYENTESCTEWLCDDPKCQEAAATDPNNDWSEYWACM